MKIGDYVAWKWASGIAEGQVLSIHTARIEIISKGKTIVRNGTVENPALVIKHISGNKVLKLASEVSTTSSSNEN